MNNKIQESNFRIQTKILIDELKNVCANAGIANDGSEYKIITQIFLYKFLNDKFMYEIKSLDKNLNKSQNLEKDLKKYTKDKYELLLMQLNPGTARLKPNQFISSIYEKQNEENFSTIFDENLLEIAKDNVSIFSILTSGGQKIILFENISKYVTDEKDEFCRALINKIINFSFENIFKEKFDFFADIFEYLIKDYNSNSNETYAEYFTPHFVSKIISKCLIDKPVKNVSCYDPSAGSGTLLMNLAHSIGENNCSIYSQDIAQKSSQLLRLNLILNNLVHSIPNIIQGNTMEEPSHKTIDNKLRKFDYIVSNPPFKTDFSSYRNKLDSEQNSERFFLGIPAIPKKEKNKMAIYLIFIQHILYSLSKKGCAAIVVPTGFLTAKGIANKIRKHLVHEEILRGVISMPSNIFATTGTNVSIIFIKKDVKNKDIILIDASNLGEKIKEGKNLKTLLSLEDQELIINSFKENSVIENFTKKVSKEEIIKKKYSFSAGQYFDLKIEYNDITAEEFNNKIENMKNEIENFNSESEMLDKEIKKNLEKLIYE